MNQSSEGESVGHLMALARDPSYLLLGYCEDEPIHIVVAQDKVSGQCFIVTAYKPDREKWSENLRSRRQ